MSTVATVATTSPTQPHFGPDKYRYVLHTGELYGALVLKKSVFISCIHKFMRRDLAVELAYLLHAFFKAVAAEPTPLPSTLAGNITNQLNRFAIALFEEGVFVHLSATLQTKTVKYLTTIQNLRQVGDSDKWDRIRELQIKILCIARGAYRGRLCSVACRHVLECREIPDPAQQRLASQLAPAALESAKHSAAVVRQTVAKYLPVVSRMLDTKYAECEELRRVVYMSAVIAEFVPDEHKKHLPSDEVPKLKRDDGGVPTMTLIHEIGAIDCHVTGKRGAKAVQGWDEFLDKGCRVANPTPVGLFGLSHEQLETNYVAGKRSDLERQEAEQPPAKKAKTVATAATAAPAAPAAPTAPLLAPVAAPVAAPPLLLPPPTWRMRVKDIHYFKVEDGDRILGFKNMTTCATLTRNVSPSLVHGARVFVKIGELKADCEFAVHCADMMNKMGMPSVPAAVVTVQCSGEWWTHYALATDTSENQKWAKYMEKKINLCAGQESVPMLICAQFEGVRLQYVSKQNPMMKTDRFGETVFQALVFSKRVGSKDLGAFNMMAAEDGTVLQVDMNAANAAQISTYNTKGLATSHKFDAVIMQAAKTYVRKFPSKAATFLREIILTVPLRAGVEWAGFDMADAVEAGDVEPFLATW